MSKDLNSILEIKRPQPTNHRKSNYRLIGITFYIVSFLFFGVTYHLFSQYKTGQCNICGLSAEWKETYVYKNSGTSGPPTYRCGIHKDSIHPCSITIWVGILCIFFGAFFMNE